MTQSWHDLLFAHWPIDVAQLRPHVPPAFDLDLFDGEAWIGIVPFHMTDVAPRGVPSLPWLSHFPELNVRTYVRVAGRPGVFFFSLDAGRALAVYTARLLLNLPYFSAAMNISRTTSAVVYDSHRTQGHVSADFRATYAAIGSPFTPTAGSLDYFLTERYCLYHHDHRGKPYRLDIHHLPWTVQPAEAEFEQNTMVQAAGVSCHPTKPVLHFSKRQDMVAWLPHGF
jgi:uncharacterized protein YqjF (DUF2071 family)